MAKKKTTKKTTSKKAQPKKTAKPADAASKKDEKPKEPRPNRVFAIRVTDEELAAIHEASGPRNATRFIRAVGAASVDAAGPAARPVGHGARGPLVVLDVSREATPGRFLRGCSWTRESPHRA